jgi:hypothetical protein
MKDENQSIRTAKFINGMLCTGSAEDIEWMAERYQGEIRQGREILRKAGLEGHISDDELVGLMREFRKTFGEVRYRSDGTAERVWPEEANDPWDVLENTPLK